MRTLLGDCNAKKIEVEEDGSIYVTTTTKTETIRIFEPQFGIGRKGFRPISVQRFITMRNAEVPVIRSVQNSHHALRKVALIDQQGCIQCVCTCPWS